MKTPKPEKLWCLERPDGSLALWSIVTNRETVRLSAQLYRTYKYKPIKITITRGWLK